MPERDTTVRSRELGAALRRLTREAGIDQRALAKRLDRAESEISRMFNGKRAVRETEVAAVLALCGAKAAERDRLLQLCAEASRRGWWQQHGSGLPAQLQTLIDHEDAARTVFGYGAILIPGLLQTGDYARAMWLGTGAIPPENLEYRVAARLARRSIFGRARTAGFTFFIHEFALRLPIGNCTIMSEQLHELLQMSVRPYIDIRIVPAAIGSHAAVVGSFDFMEFAEITPVVYVESETSALFLEEDAEIATYRRILGALASVALDAGQSQAFIRTLAVELYGSEDDGDA